jgi:SAM-dependent methyltransferase
MAGSTIVTSDPTPLYRLRDGVYAPDLLIAAVADLDLFSWLDQAAADPRQICDAFGLADRPVDVLLTYLVALGLLAREGDRVTVPDLARDHLVAGSVYDLRAYYASLRERPGCAELRGVLETGEPAAWASASMGEDWVARLDDPAFAAGITAAMDARGAFLGPRLASAIADLPARRVLDIGGSSGIYLCALVDARADLRGTVFERSPIDSAARALLRERGYADRVDVATGDMFSDPLPEGHDLHLFSHVLHDWDEGSVRGLLAASYSSLAPGGWFVDHDVHINADKTGPLPAAEYSVFLMHATPGKCWSVAELGGLLEACGFAEVSWRDTAGDRSVVLARKPA